MVQRTLEYKWFYSRTGQAEWEKCWLGTLPTRPQRDINKATYDLLEVFYYVLLHVCRGTQVNT